MPGINIRLEAVFSRVNDSILTSAVTDKEGKYSLTTVRGIIDQYTDTSNINYRPATLRLVAEPVQAGQRIQYRNHYQTDRKNAPDLFFSRLSLSNEVLQQSKIKQDIKMRTGAFIICNNPAMNSRTTVYLDVTGLQKPQDHIRVVVDNRKYLVVRPNHPYLVNIIHQQPGMDSITAYQILKQDTIRLQPMDSLAINISPDMLRSMPVNR